MKTLQLFFHNIPRKRKILLNILLILLLAFWSYLLLGSPTSIRAIYRRVERANLVEPGEILAVLENPGQGFDYTVFAEDRNHVMVYFHDWEDPRRSQFVYRERSMGMVLLSLPADNITSQLQSSLPVFLFDGYADAVQAELVLSLPDENTSTDVLHARREDSGFFRFSLESKALSPAHTSLIHRLRLLSGNTMADLTPFSLCALVRLYDENNVLLTQTELTLKQ